MLAPGTSASPAESMKATSAPRAGTTARLNQGLATQQDGGVYSLLSYHSGISLFSAMNTNKPNENLKIT